MDRRKHRRRLNPKDPKTCLVPTTSDRGTDCMDRSDRPSRNCRCDSRHNRSRSLEQGAPACPHLEAVAVVPRLAGLVTWLAAADHRAAETRHMCAAGARPLYRGPQHRSRQIHQRCAMRWVAATVRRFGTRNRSRRQSWCARSSELAQVATQRMTHSGMEIDRRSHSAESQAARLSKVPGLARSELVSGLALGSTARATDCPALPRPVARGRAAIRKVRMSSICCAWFWLSTPQRQ